MHGLQAVVLERRFISALVKQPNGTYGYQSVVKEDEIHRAPFAVSADGTDTVLPSGQPGRYALELIDANGLKLSRVEFTVAGAQQSGRQHRARRRTRSQAPTRNATARATKSSWR